MRQELICITCPIGCHLWVEGLAGGEIQVSGNKCPRGAVYAREETVAPKRVVTATCRAGGYRDPHGPRPSLAAPRRVPIRTTGAIPREGIAGLLESLYALELSLPVRKGDVVMRDVLGTGIDVVVTRSIG